MTNSADELHALYSSWRARVADSPGANMGALVDPHGAGMDEIVKAYALLRALDTQLRHLATRNARVAVHQRALTRWARVPLMLQTGWNAGVTDPNQIVNEATLDQIETLSSFLDDKVLAWDDELLPSLRAAIDRADALLTAEPDMDPHLTRYLRRLIAEIRYALDDEAAGRLFDYTTASEQLRVAFMAAAEAAPPAQKDEWRQMAKQLFVGLFTWVLTEGGKSMLGITS